MKTSTSKISLGLVTSGSSLQISKSSYTSNNIISAHVLPLRSSISIKNVGPSVSRTTSSKVISNVDKKIITQAVTSGNTKTTMSYTSAIMTAGRTTKIITTNTSQTFAAKLSEIYTATQVNNTTSAAHCNQNANNVIGVLKQNSISATVSTVSTVLSSTTSTIQVSSQQPIISTSLISSSANPIKPISFTTTSHCLDKPNFQNDSSTPSVNTAASTVNVTSTISTLTGCVNTNLPLNVSQPVTLQQQYRSSTPTTNANLDSCQSLANISLEYSLFNDSFSKVTRQSMWGNKEIDNQKNVNFATIAGAGISNSTTTTSNKFIDSNPIEVDASKAPGYRGTSVCSPTSNKSNNSNNMCNSSISLGPVSTVSNSIQPITAQSSVKFATDHASMKSSPSLVIARPIVQQKNVDINVANITPFNRPVFHSNMDSSQNILGNHKSCNVTPISQSNIEINMFSENTVAYENQNLNSNLLRIVPEGQSTVQSMLPIPQHIQNYPQTASPSATVTTTISMSRLNPRAPDFSSSLHINNKSQVTMFNAGTPMHPNIFSSLPAQSPSAVVQPNNLAMLGNFALNKYTTLSQRQSNTNMPTCNQNRWPFTVATANFSQHQETMIGQGNFSEHLTPIGTQSGSMDIINLENGSTISPAISPTSSGQINSQDISQIQVEDRKVPRPIGTERTWKNYSTILSPGGDADNITWMINNEKHMNSWTGIPSNSGNQLYCSNTTYNRISSTDTDLQQVIETPYQVSIYEFNLIW